MHSVWHVWLWQAETLRGRGGKGVHDLCKNKFTHDYQAAAAEVTTASARLIKLKQNGAWLHKFQQAL